jgi:hypothetical protein
MEWLSKWIRILILTHPFFVSFRTIEDGEESLESYPLEVIA